MANNEHAKLPEPQGFENLAGLKPTVSGWLVSVLLIAILSAITAAIFITQRRATVATINGRTISRERFQAEVRLKQVQDVMRRRDRQEVNQAALLNRMIGDTLLLQAAAEAGVTVDETEVQSSIDAILLRTDLTRSEMVVLLDDHALPWQAFETSVREYLTLAHYINDVLLADVALEDRQERLQMWVSEQYDDAEMTFDQDFLDTINSDEVGGL